jgi:quinol monooxygenase YgiN
MDTRAVRLLVDLTIQEQAFAMVESLAQEMIAGSRKEPGTLGYDWYLSTDRRRCRLVETYVDANAVLAHFKGPVVEHLVPKLMEHAKLERFEVYGDPGAEAGTILRSFGAATFEPWHVLSR